jgi:alpha-D-xyloside xylohydrolase
VLLVKDHSVIPHAAVAQSTSEINWGEIELRLFSTDNAPATGLFALPQDSIQTLRLEAAPNGFVMKDDPLRGRVKWRIKRIEAR